MRMFYPGGAGGRWLIHLIGCLHTNNSPKHNQQHYHTSSREYNIDNSMHADYDSYTSNDIMFTGDCIYDFYANYVHKFYYVDKELAAKDYSTQVNHISGSSFTLFSLSNHPQNQQADLRYEMLIGDQERFITELFKVLSLRNVPYHANHQIAHEKIHEFKRTVIDPFQTYGNPESILWLGWCIGYMLYHDIECGFDLRSPYTTNKVLAKSKELDIAGKSQKYLLRP